MIDICMEKEKQSFGINQLNIKKRLVPEKKKEKIIGIVGGMGPWASLDLTKKILDQTNAVKDQDHLSLILLSAPSRIEDRTEFLLGKKKTNPAKSISNVIKQLYELGANIIGIPCNTTFAPEIYDEVLREINEVGIEVKIIHLIEEVALYMQKYYPEIKDVGILCTQGLYSVNGYALHFLERGFNAILPDEHINYNFVHKTIYDPEYGLKAKFNPVTEKAMENLFVAIDHLVKKDAKAVILGCTELSFAINNKIIKDTIIIDPVVILARSLIKAVDESKLRVIE